MERLRKRPESAVKMDLNRICIFFKLIQARIYKIKLRHTFKKTPIYEPIFKHRMLSISEELLQKAVVKEQPTSQN